MEESLMHYRRLGESGCKVSVLSLGGWTTYGGSVKDDQVIRTIIKTAFENGINFFDIADVYAKGECERVMGRALREFPRKNLVISSKVFWPMSDDINDRGLSRKHIFESVDKSLSRIGTEYLDLYFCHRFDSETPLEETARAMDDLVHQGKILYWGTSEWSGAQLHQIHGICKANNLYKPQVEQPQYNLLTRQRFEFDVAPATKTLGMGAVVWSPLASGLLTGKYDDAIPPDSRFERLEWLREGLFKESNISRVRAFGERARSLGVSPAQLALAWAAAHAEVSSVILGATKVEQLTENLKSLRIRVTQDIMDELDKVFAVH